MWQTNVPQSSRYFAYVKEDTLLEVANHTELFLIDLKVMDSDKHRKYTGVPNEQILSNISLLAKTNCNIIFRMPLISSVNTDEENIINTAKFIKSLEGDSYKINLLPYHNIATKKHKKLGMTESRVNFETPSQKEMQKILSIFDSYQIEASIGG